MKVERIRRTIVTLIIVAYSLWAGTASGETNTYTFDPNQSTVVRSFFTSDTYNVTGAFQLTVDANSGSFDWIDATFSDDPNLQTQTGDLEELFYMGELVGDVVNDTTIEFELPPGHPVRQSYDIHITVTFQNDQVHLAGYRNPLMVGEPGYTLDAVANDVTTYDLTMTVVSGHGTVEPNSGSYSAGTVVTLTATPEAGYWLRQWTGTDDDTSYALANTVTMDSDKTVTVEFRLPTKIEVSGDPNALRDAVNAAGNGDTLVVAAGTYNGGINFNGKNIRVFSTNPDDPNIVAQTVIQGTGAGPVVTFSGSESQSCVLDGFIITGGNTTGDGGGICGNGTEAMIANCVITNNHADGAGGGVSNCNGTILSCTITGNTAGGGGGGIYVFSSPILIEDCRISRNNAMHGGGGVYLAGYGYADPASGGVPRVRQCLITENTAGEEGGGISCEWFVEPIISNCTIAENAVADGYGGGLYCSYHSDVEVINSIIWGNFAQQGFQVAVSSGDEYDPRPSTLTISYSDVEGGPGGAYVDAGSMLDWGIGTIDSEPQLVDPNGGDWHLGAGSPCIDAGDNTAVPPSLVKDLDGRPRIVNGTVDMGAYEFQGMLTLYVDADAPQFGDGTSWATAFRHLKDALFNATSGTEIKVAEGIYKPHLNTYILAPPSRYDTFLLINGVTIKGGYAGLGQPDPNARDISLYETILSGDMNGDDFEVAEPCDLLTEPTRAENSIHVVTGSGTDATAILDGFTITGGNADGPYPDNCGGGIYCKSNSSSPTITSCILSGNSAKNCGGGLYNEPGSPTIIKCIFIGNYAGNKGGGMRTGYGNPTLKNCIFIGNSAKWYGGGIRSFHSDSTLINCVFSNNSARISGGGIYNYDSDSMFISCTFRGNSAQENGGGIGNSGGLYDNSQPTVVDCILWGNTDNAGMSEDEAAQIHSGTPIINYSCIQGWTGILGGTGNIGDDPLFVDANGTDNVAGTEDDNLRLSFGSPCIDTGDNTAVPPSVLTDLDGNPRIVNGTVDMGAYEFCGPILYVDDDGPNDPGPGEPAVSDPLENGTEAHPFDDIQEAINVAKDGYTVLVRPGSYLELMSGNNIDFLGKNITLTSEDPTDWDIVDNTIVRGYVQFSGTENPNCKFTGFKIRNLEGAIYGNHTHATISHCNISGNGPCGATVIKDCDGTISNCLITDNLTFFYCGVYPVVFGCNGLIKNCTIANNISGVSVSTATIKNCIIYNNAGSQLGVGGLETLNISYCNLQGGLEGITGGGSVNWGPGNIDTDPCFVRAGYWEGNPLELIEGDYHLRSEGWRWNTEGKSWTYDYITSRCADAGNLGSPLQGELMSVPRDPNNVWGINLRINMGAYGGTGQASMPPHGWALPADLNNDGIVNFLDFAYQAHDWLTTAPEQPGDLNRDGVMNMIDFARLANDWLQVTDWVE